MKKQKSNLPAVIEKATVPKPTQAEIIEALVALRGEEVKKENAALQEKWERLVREIRALGLPLLIEKASKCSADKVTVGYSGDYVELEVRIEAGHSKELTSLLKQLSTVPKIEAWNDYAIKEYRNEVRVAMNGNRARVKALLDNPDSRKELQTLSNRIFSI